MASNNIARSVGHFFSSSKKAILTISLFLQAQEKYVSLYPADGEQLIRISLKELADQLDPNLFVQVHRSTIVNMRSVVTADRDFTGRVMLTLKDVKEKVQVSRQYAHLFTRM